MPDPLDFFFFYGSTYTYLTVMRIEEVAARSGVEVRWRPFNVREIMIEQNNIPFRDKPVKRRCVWRDIERRAARYGIPFDRIPKYPVDPEGLANRVGVVAATEGWCPEYTRATYRAWFGEDWPPGDPGHLRSVLITHLPRPGPGRRALGGGFSRSTRQVRRRDPSGPRHGHLWFAHVCHRR